MQKLKKTMIATLAFLISFGLVGGQANAGMISTSNAVAGLARAQNLEKVQSFLQRADVKEQLVKRGVNPVEAGERLASLSDFELNQVAGNIETAPAGAEPVVVIGVTTLLLILIIVLLVAK